MAAALNARGEALCSDRASVRALSRASRSGLVASFGNILRFTGTLKEDISCSSHCASPSGARSIMVLRARAAALPGVVLSANSARDVVLALLPALLKGGRAERRRGGIGAAVSGEGEGERRGGVPATVAWGFDEEGVPSCSDLATGARLVGYRDRLGGIWEQAFICVRRPFFRKGRPHCGHGACPTSLGVAAS